MSRFVADLQVWCPECGWRQGLLFTVRTGPGGVELLHPPGHVFELVCFRCCHEWSLTALGLQAWRYRRTPLPVLQPQGG